MRDPFQQHLELSQKLLLLNSDILNPGKKVKKCLFPCLMNSWLVKQFKTEEEVETLTASVSPLGK